MQFSCIGKTYFPCYFLLFFFYIDPFSTNGFSIRRFQFFLVLSRHMKHCPRISHFLLETWKVSVKIELPGASIQQGASRSERPAGSIICEHPGVSI